MRIFKIVIGNDIRYVCAPKRTKVSAEYEIVTDVTKKVHADPHYTLDELDKTELSEPVKELICALLDEHNKRIKKEA